MSTTEDTPVRASFTSFAESTAEDWQLIMSSRDELLNALPDRILEQLGHLAGDYGGFPVDRLTHSLQTATRAEAAGHDDEYVLCALLHDIGDPLTPHNHPDLAAAILKPFVSPGNHFMVQNHGIFQGYYFWHHLGMDRNTRDRFDGHEFYDRTETFCAEYDQPAFDGSAPTNPLEHYEPLIREFFTAPPRHG